MFNFFIYLIIITIRYISIYVIVVIFYLDKLFKI